MTFRAPIGSSLPRDRAKRLLAGRGRYIDDIVLPRMLHLAFVRSPFPRARIDAIDTVEAAQMPGVVRVVTGKDLEGVVASWRVLTIFFPT